MFSDIRAWLEPWYNKWAVMVLSAAVGLGGYEWICWSKLTASDWGTWVGAIGTVATLIGTIHLATNAERQRRREQLDLAIVATASVTVWVSDLRQAIWVAMQTLPGDLDAPDNASEALKDCVKTIEKPGLWGSEDIRPLVCLPNHVAARLASISVQIRSALRTLRKEADKPDLTMEEIVGIRTVLSIYFESFAKELKSIEHECSVFLSTHNVNPFFVE